MDNINFDKYKRELSINHVWSGEPILTIYESITEGLIFSLRDGEYSAELKKTDVDLFIKYMTELTRHEDSKQ